MLSPHTGESVSNQTWYDASTMEGLFYYVSYICHDLCLVVIDTQLNTLLGANFGLKRGDFSPANVCVRGMHRTSYQNEANIIRTASAQVNMLIRICCGEYMAMFHRVHGGRK